MADNTQVVGGTGDTIRDKDRGGVPAVKTQIVGLDLNIGGGSEILMTGAMPIIGNQPAATVGTIGSATATVQANVTNYSNVTITANGTHAGVNLTFEASDDGGTTWYLIQVQRESDGAPLTTTGVLASNSASMFMAGCAGITHIRVRATAWTSGGTNMIRISPGAMPFDPVVTIGNWQTSATATVTNVAASATNVTLKAANTARKALYIFNAGTNNLFVKLGATATATTSFSAMLLPNALWELPDDPIYTGIVDGIWSATGGNGALVTELT